MATEIIRPSGAGTYTELTPSTGANYACVDESSKNESDYVGTNINSYVKDLYAMQNPSVIVEGDTINSITVYAYVASTQYGYPVGYPVYSKLSIKCGAYSADSSAQTTTTTYSLKSNTWTTNDGSPWTLTDLQNLEAGIQIMSGSELGQYSGRCCQLWVEIDYTVNATFGGGSFHRGVGRGFF